jgi:hypothetical protein
MFFSPTELVSAWIPVLESGLVGNEFLRRLQALALSSSLRFSRERPMVSGIQYPEHPALNTNRDPLPQESDLDIDA